MDKMTMMEFCLDADQNGQLIQSLFFKIRVKDLYWAMTMKAAEDKNVHQSVGFKKTYDRFLREMKDSEKMTVGELFQFVQKECFTGFGEAHYVDEDRVRLGNRLLESLFVNVFGYFAFLDGDTYDGLLERLRETADAV